MKCNKNANVIMSKKVKIIVVDMFSNFENKKGKQQNILNKLLILLAITCISVAVVMISLFLNKKEIFRFAKNAENMKENYTSTETNTWDISTTENDNVIATLSDDETLTISGTGNMRDWGNNDITDWHGTRNKVYKKGKRGQS